MVLFLHEHKHIGRFSNLHCCTFKDDKEMAFNGFRSAGNTEATENAKNMVEKNYHGILIVKHVYKHMKRCHDSLFFSFLISLFLNTLPYPTPLNQIMV